MTVRRTAMAALLVLLIGCGGDGTQAELEERVAELEDQLAAQAPSTAVEAPPTTEARSTTTRQTTTTTRPTTTTGAVAAFNWNAVTLDDLEEWFNGGAPREAALSLVGCEASIEALGVLFKILIEGVLPAYEVGLDVQNGVKAMSEGVEAFEGLAEATGTSGKFARYVADTSLDSAALDFASKTVDVLFDVDLHAFMMGSVFSGGEFDTEALNTWGPGLEKAVREMMVLHSEVGEAIRQC